MGADRVSDRTQRKDASVPTLKNVLLDIINPRKATIQGQSMRADLFDRWFASF
jgi:hypothetical protein